MIFITGGAWQGKTAFAETLAAGRATPGIGEHVLYAGLKTEERTLPVASGRGIRLKRPLRGRLSADFITL